MLADELQRQRLDHLDPVRRTVDEVDQCVDAARRELEERRRPMPGKTGRLDDRLDRLFRR